MQERCAYNKWIVTKHSASLWNSHIICVSPVLCSQTYEEHQDDMNESPYGEMIFHNSHWKMKPNRHKREREGMGKEQVKTSWSLGLRGKVDWIDWNSTFRLAGFTNTTQLTHQHAGCTLLDITNTPKHVLMKDCCFSLEKVLRLLEMQM